MTKREIRRGRRLLRHVGIFEDWMLNFGVILVNEKFTIFGDDFEKSLRVQFENMGLW